MKAFVFWLALVVGAAAAELDVITTDGRRAVSLTVRAPAGSGEDYQLAAGSIFEGAGSVRMITLREARASLPPGGSAHLEVPAAALAFTSAPALAGPARLLGMRETTLEPLLAFLATQNDLPRATSQCAVFAVLADVTFAQWQEHVLKVQAPASPEAAAAATDALVEAVDAVALLHALYPGQAFRLASDPELKVRALRQPGLRAKALQVFGVELPGAPAAAAPDLGRLLHTKPGDNCPICRLRDQMQRPASDL